MHELGDTLGHADDQVEILLGIGIPVLDILIARLDELPELHRLITSAIAQEASAGITGGNIIELGLTSSGSVSCRSSGMVLVGLLNWEAKRETRSGITGLKIDYTTRRMAIISMSVNSQ